MIIDFLSLCVHASRQDEGTVSEGYTVHEMCQLARSSLPAQRAFACRHLAALLARARPLMADAHVALFGNGRIPKPLNVPGSDLVVSSHTVKEALPAAAQAFDLLEQTCRVMYGFQRCDKSLQ